MNPQVKKFGCVYGLCECDVAFYGTNAGIELLSTKMPG